VERKKREKKGDEMKKKRKKGNENRECRTHQAARGRSKLSIIEFSGLKYGTVHHDNATLERHNVNTL
jgi:hypothetical protein